MFVAAAGFRTSGRVLDAEIEEERAMLAVNCGAVLVQTHMFARRFQERGRSGLVSLPP
jgi:short-subunit dehydrogenase